MTWSWKERETQLEIFLQQEGGRATPPSQPGSSLSVSSVYMEGLLAVNPNRQRVEKANTLHLNIKLGFGCFFPSLVQTEIHAFSCQPFIECLLYKCRTIPDNYWDMKVHYKIHCPMPIYVGTVWYVRLHAVIQILTKTLKRLMLSMFFQMRELRLKEGK